MKIVFILPIYFIYFLSQDRLSCFSYPILPSIFIISLVYLMSAIEIDFI